MPTYQDILAAARKSRAQAARPAAEVPTTRPEPTDVPPTGEGAGTSVGTSWRDRPLRGCPVAVIDLETTGIDPATARVVEVAVVLIDRLGETEPRLVLCEAVNPGEPIPEASTKAHGLTDADVATSPSWPDVWARVRQWLDGDVPCAYNAAYEYQVLAAEAARHGCPPPPGWAGWIDPMILARFADKYESGKKLSQVASRRGIVVDAHGAAGDAMTTAMLLPKLLGDAARAERHRRPVEGRPTAADLATVGAYAEWQHRTALAQERDLVEFLAEGGRQDPVDCPWHRLVGMPVPTATTKRAAGTAKCSSCNAPIVWAVTKKGARMPLDPPEIRASVDGPGREVTLVLAGGEVRGRLREDPGGDVVGRESHYATCPNGPAHRRKAAPEATTPAPKPEPVATQPELAGARVRVVSAPIGPRCAVRTDDGRLVIGSRVPDDYVGIGPSEVVTEGRCVEVRTYDSDGNLVFDERGRQQIVSEGVTKSNPLGKSWRLVVPRDAKGDAVVEVVDAAPPVLATVRRWTDKPMRRAS